MATHEVDDPVLFARGYLDRRDVTRQCERIEGAAARTAHHRGARAHQTLQLAASLTAVKAAVQTPVVAVREAMVVAHVEQGQLLALVQLQVSSDGVQPRKALAGQQQGVVREAPTPTRRQTADSSPASDGLPASHEC